LDTYHYIIGDIHGCYAELQLLEKKISRHAAKAGVKPLFVSVGDLVDRGPNSASVVRHIREGVENGTHACIAGNHEQIMLNVLNEFVPQIFEEADCKIPDYLTTVAMRFEDGVRYAKYLDFEDYRIFSKLNWLGQGGSSTLKSYGCNPTDLSDWRIPVGDLKFLCELPLLFECDSAVVTHALASKEDLALVKKYMKSGIPVTKHRSLESLTWSRDKPTESPDSKRIHVSGHSILPRVKRDTKLNIIQVDTGCVASQKLSAYCPELDKVFSVPSLSKV
jgi:hypothetical protein